MSASADRLGFPAGLLMGKRLPSSPETCALSLDTCFPTPGLWSLQRYYQQPQPSLLWSNFGQSCRTNIWAEWVQALQITWGNRQCGALERALGSAPVLFPWLSHHYLVT